MVTVSASTLVVVVAHQRSPDEIEGSGEASPAGLFHRVPIWLLRLSVGQVKSPRTDQVGPGKKKRKKERTEKHLFFFFFFIRTYIRIPRIIITKRKKIVWSVVTRNSPFGAITIY
jgi:hypothetical protein